MSLFSRRRPTSPEQEDTRSRVAVSSMSSSSAARPQPLPERWTTELVRDEWARQLESPEQAALGWRNGMRLFDQGVVPGQRLNAAEYMTRGLAYHLFPQPVLQDDDAKEAIRRILVLLEGLPAEPAFLKQFAPRLARLALTVARDNRWQPRSLGGDGSIEQIGDLPPAGIVTSAVSTSHGAGEEAVRRFFES